MQDELNILRTQILHGQSYILKAESQTQHEATKAYEEFHRHFARYVSRIEDGAVSPYFMTSQQQSGQAVEEEAEEVSFQWKNGLLLLSRNVDFLWQHVDFIIKTDEPQSEPVSEC